MCKVTDYSILLVVYIMSILSPCGTLGVSEVIQEIFMPRCACTAKAYGSLLVFLSVCYRDSGSTCAIQVLKHAQMGRKPCFLRFKLARFLR